MITAQILLVIRDTENGNHLQLIRGETFSAPPLSSTDEAAKASMRTVVEKMGKDRHSLAESKPSQC